MKLSSALFSGVAAAGVLIASGAAEARADDQPMPIGEVVAAPAGFLALCEASPADCADGDLSPQTLTAVRTWAAQTRWSHVFAAAGIATATPAPSVAERRSAAPASIRVESRQEVRARKDAARKVAARPGAGKPKGAPVKPAPAVAPEPAPIPETITPVADTPAASLSAVRPTLEALQTVNRRVNREIRRSSDLGTFGQADVWVAPVGPRPRGDCEDYVLAKRRALIEAGVSPASLSIALVRTRRGEAHAVLLVATENGEYVMDNLSPWVVRWDEAPYQWLERQAQGSSLTWVRAGVSQAA